MTLESTTVAWQLNNVLHCVHVKHWSRTQLPTHDQLLAKGWVSDVLHTEYLYSEEREEKNTSPVRICNWKWKKVPIILYLPVVCPYFPAGPNGGGGGRVRRTIWYGPQVQRCLNFKRSWWWRHFPQKDKLCEVLSCIASRSKCLKNTHTWTLWDVS
jgi:hypothetical protein